MVKRFEPWWADQEMCEMPFGEYVRHEDYIVLQAALKEALDGREREEGPSEEQAAELRKLTEIVTEKSRALEMDWLSGEFKNWSRMKS